MKVQSPQELGVLVREEREKRSWTQSELAKRAGVRRLWISEFERGKTTAQIGLVFRTLKALGVMISVEKLAKPSMVDLGAILEDLTGESVSDPEK